jgi:hypothetical protein
MRWTGHIKIEGMGQSEDGLQFARLRARARGKSSKLLLPLKGISPSSPEFDRLNAKGARLISPAARRELIDRIQAFEETEEPVAVVTRIGWHDTSFVLPGKVYGTGDLLVHLPSDRPERYTRYRACGTLKGWRTIPKLAVGNTKLQLALIMAFVGPVAALLGIEQPGVMLVGDGATGKTTAVVAAGSVWGRHIDDNMATKLGFGIPFNATDNDLEDEAVAASHTLLAVDETRTAAGDEGKIAAALVGTVMRWESGFGKGRQTSVARGSFSVPFLVTSNLSLDALAAKARQTVDEAHHGRLISVPLPAGGHGIFEKLHGKADAVALCKRLRAISAQHPGVASRKLLRSLVGWRARNEAGLVSWIKRRRAFYLKKVPKAVNGTERNLSRIHEKMATLYAAGCLATKFGIVPWTFRSIRKALVACTRDHVALVARENAAASFQGAEPFNRLRGYVREHGATFIDLRSGTVRETDDHDHSACQGYIHEHQENGLEYLFPDRRFEEVVGGAQAAKSLKAELARRGHIEMAAGSGWERYSVKRVIGRRADRKPNRRQVIAIRAAAFEL